jgi:hypothetical protein
MHIRYARHWTTLGALAILLGSSLIPAAGLGADAGEYQTVDYCWHQHRILKCIDSTVRATNAAGTVVGDFVVQQGFGTIEQIEVHGMSFPTEYGFVHQGDTYTLVKGPFGPGYDTHLLGIDNGGHVLVQQYFQGIHWYLYDLSTHEFAPLGLAGELQTAQGPQAIHLARFTGLSADGQFFAAYTSPKGPCAISGRPAVGASGDKRPPTEAGVFSLIGCPQGPPRVGLNIVGSNANGQIVGDTLSGQAQFANKAFLWDKGTFTLLTYQGSPNLQATAVSRDGTVLGSFQVRELVSKGFMYRAGQYTTLDIPQSSSVVPLGFGPNGEVLGEYSGARGGHDGFVMHHAGGPP